MNQASQHRADEALKTLFTGISGHVSFTPIGLRSQGERFQFANPF